MRARILSAAIVVLVLATAAAWLALRPRPPLVLGLVSSLSGRFAPLGTACRDGAILALEEVNASGGVLGRQLAFDIRDDQGTGEACVTAIEGFAANGQRIVIGPYATGPATGALPTINRLGVLTIGATVAGDNFAGLDDWFIRLFPSTREMGLSLGAMIAADGVRHLAIFGDTANGPFVASLVSGLSETAARGIPQDRLDFDSRTHPVLSDLAAQAGNADGALIIAATLDTAALAQRLRERQPALRLYCAPWAVSNELLTNGGAALDGLRTVLPLAMHGREWEVLAERYQRRFGSEPPHAAVIFHEAVILTVAAIRQAGSADPVAVKAALISGRPLPGAPAEVVLSPTGDPLRRLIPHRVVAGRLIAEP